MFAIVIKDLEVFLRNLNLYIKKKQFVLSFLLKKMTNKQMAGAFYYKN